MNHAITDNYSKDIADIDKKYSITTDKNFNLLSWDFYTQKRKCTGRYRQVHYEINNQKGNKKDVV